MLLNITYLLLAYLQPCKHQRDKLWWHKSN